MIDFLKKKFCGNFVNIIIIIFLEMNFQFPDRMATHTAPERRGGEAIS